MADWQYEQIAIHGQRDEDKVRDRLAGGWELVGYTRRGRLGTGVRHAILRLRRIGDATAPRPKWNRGLRAAEG